MRTTTTNSRPYACCSRWRATWPLRRSRKLNSTSRTNRSRKRLTALDQHGLTARDIAEYLGHQNPSLTQDVYMAKNTGGAKATSAMESLVHHA